MKRGIHFTPQQPFDVPVTLLVSGEARAGMPDHEPNQYGEDSQDDEDGFPWDPDLQNPDELGGDEE